MKTLVFPSKKKYLRILLVVSFAILYTSSSLVLAQQIAIEPDTLNLNMSNTFTIKNIGENRLDYVIESNTSFRTFHSNVLTELNSLPVSPGPNDIAAVPNNAKWVSEISPDDNYSNWRNTYWLNVYRGFEGWASTGENWEVIKSGYFKYYYRGLSDGSSVISGLFSPRVEVGSETISSFSMEVNLIYSSGTTWQIVPQSLNNNMVATRFQINPDHTIQVLVRDSLGQASFKRINIDLPIGYFYLSMEVNRKNSFFTIFINGQRVFTGRGFADNVDQVAVLSLNESSVASLQINGVTNNLEIRYPFSLIGCNPLVLIASDNENNYSDLNNVSGYLEPGTSVTRSLSFSESDLLPGVYRDSIKISTNDSVNSLVFLPYSVAVNRPYIQSADYSSPPAGLELAYDSLDVTIYKGDTVAINLTLKNRSAVPQSVYFPTPAEIPLYKAFSHGSQNFDWKEISKTGTPIFLGNDDSQTVLTPFNGYITIGSNGYLALGSAPANDPNNRQIYDTYSLLSNIIAPYWDDLAPDELSGIYYQADSNEFIVQYTDIPFNETNIRNTFQVIIYSDGVIKFQYLYMNDRQSATIAIAPGSTSYLWMDIANNEPFVTDSLAILFQTPNFYKEADNEFDTKGNSFYPWIIYPQESSITVAPESSQPVTIQITTKYYSNTSISNLPSGVTKSYIHLLSHPFLANSYEPNDIGHQDASAFVLPISITVLENSPPIIEVIKSLTILEGTTADFNITATDINDSTVTIYFDSTPDFITPLHSENRSITYKIAPTYGDAGEYKLVIHAKDPHGAIGTDTLHLTVSHYYSISDFSLTYFKTGVIASTFIDSVTLDVADPDIEKYTIRANTIAGKIGSVQFTLDGNLINTDNSWPYTINYWELSKLNAGVHTLSAQAFSKRNARGDKYKTKEALIYIINSVEIIQFDLVDIYGNVIRRIFDGDIFNITDPELEGFNVIANTNINTSRSVKFILNNITARIDNRAPYGVYGTSNGYETPWPINPGLYKLTAIPYMHYYGWGPEGKSLTVHFSIVKNAKTTTNVAFGREESSEDIELNSEPNRQLIVYPNPVIDDLHIDLSKIAEGNFVLKILNTNGQLLYSLQGNTKVISEHIISTNQLGIKGGVYYIQLIDANEFLEVKKIMKQ